MATSSQEIIGSVHKQFPAMAPGLIWNCSDINIERSSGYFNQFIIGLTSPDVFGNGIEYYTNNMSEKLQGGTRKIKTFAWGYNDYEMDEVEAVLNELSTHFNADLEVKKMIENAVRAKTDLYYIVITVVRIWMLYGGQ